MLTSKKIALAASILWSLLIVTAAVAQDPRPMKEAKPGLLAQAKIAPETARTTALSKVKGGTIKEEEIEEEHGKLVYSFDIQAPGKSGIEEVQVDAHTGKVVSVEHESAKQAADEAAKDARVARLKGKKPTSRKN